jgi:hypothetical protein
MMTKVNRKPLVTFANPILYRQENDRTVWLLDTIFEKSLSVATIFVYLPAYTVGVYNEIPHFRIS